MYASELLFHEIVGITFLFLKCTFIIINISIIGIFLRRTNDVIGGRQEFLKALLVATLVENLVRILLYIRYHLAITTTTTTILDEYLLLLLLILQIYLLYFIIIVFIIMAGGRVVGVEFDDFVVQVFSFVSSVKIYYLVFFCLLSRALILLLLFVFFSLL